MNNTKWREVRSAMHALGPESPRWRLKDLESGRELDWDFDWYYQFLGDGTFEWIEWCEIECKTPEARAAVLDALRKIHVAGEETEEGVRIYGWAKSAASVDWL